MRRSLGLSIGATNLVAATARQTTVSRAVLTLYSHRAPAVGTAPQPGLELSGFVERVGDPVPIVAADGSTHLGDRLVAVAVEAMIAQACPDQWPAKTVVAVPAHWHPNVMAALQGRLPHLQVVSDAVAALTALQGSPGLPARGVVALCDFGATGTSITLVDAGAGFGTVGHTVRYDEFSGDLIDQAVLTHVLAGVEADPSGTSAVASLTRLRAQCRTAKERLSVEIATGLSGPRSALRLTRAELEERVRGPLDGAIAALADTLARNGVAPAELAAIATVGGGARIPLVTQRLSEAFRRPVITSAQPALVAAIGADILAVRGSEHDAATELAAAVPLTTAVAAQSAATVAAPAAPALAWSAVVDDDDAARPDVVFHHTESVEQEVAPLSWWRRPGVLFAGAACFAAMATVGLVLTSGADPAPAEASGASASIAPEAEAPPAPAAPVVQEPVTETVVITQMPSPPTTAARPPAPSAPRVVAAAPVAPPPAAAPPTVVPPPPVAPEPEPSPTPPPEPSPQPEPSPTPSPTPSPSPTPTPTPQPEPTPAPSPEPSPSPQPEPTPQPSPQPEPAPSQTPQPEPEPSAQPEPEPTVTLTPLPDADQGA